MTSPLLSLRKISKDFGGHRVNDGIDWSINPGEIHALIGENGAGKSTLMKILMGLEKPTEGEILWRGQPAHFRSALDAQKAGLSMVHQHFMQAERMTALEHLALETSAQAPGLKRFWPLPWKELRKTAEQLSSDYQMPLRWDLKIRDLSVGEQQRLEILKALAQKGDLLILDEPTAVLSPGEVEAFLDQLVALKAKGKTLILITHKLKEVLRIADRVAVLRRGRLVWDGPRAGETESSLAQKMVGADWSPSIDLSDKSFSPRPLLSVKVTGGSHKLDARRRLGPWNFEIRRHEVLGIAGVDGNGQDELVESLFHPEDFNWDADSAMTLEQIELRHLRADQIRDLGVAWIPADRLQQGAVLQMNATENSLLGKQRSASFQSRGQVHWQTVKKDLRRHIEMYDIRPPRPDLLLSAYSGGNQQKIVVARELAGRPRLICACHPTRGVDLAAMQRIHRELLRAREHAGVLLLSADLDELMALSDRILVFYRGEIRAELLKAQFDLRKIGCAMAGLQ